MHFYNYPWSDTGIWPMATKTLFSGKKILNIAAHAAVPANFTIKFKKQSYLSFMSKY